MRVAPELCERSLAFRGATGLSSTGTGIVDP
jgi:hypothetical protein